jgi:hypothetical protein
VVRLAFTAVDLGTAFVSVFDGASEEEELVQLTGVDWGEKYRGFKGLT